MGKQPQLISRWMNDNDRPPGRDSIRLIARETGVSAAWLEYGGGPPVVDPEIGVGGGGYPAQETPEEAVAIDMPRVSYLKPEAEALYRQYLGEFVEYGWTREILADAAHELVRHFELENQLNSGGPGRPAYSVEQQLMILRTARQRIGPDFGGTGRGRRR